jgi:hypothetical protein
MPMERALEPPCIVMIQHHHDAKEFQRVPLLLNPTYPYEALVWGQFLHVLGDLVTPAGVPLLYPFSSRDVGLPRPFSQWGETLVTVAAIIAGYWLLTSAA